MFFKVIQTIFIILEVLLIFNLMIIVHELGHFLAARWRGLVIEKFGIWFGKPLWKKTIGGVEYSLGSIPAGGFVALPQLAPMEVMEGKVETPRELLPPISALDKIIVAFAGPLFSFGLAFLFALIVWQGGRPVGEAESTTVIGVVMPDSPAAEAKLQPGDKILAIDGHKVTRFNGMGEDSITWRIVRSEDAKVEVTVERAGQTMNLYVSPKVTEKAHWWNRKGLRTIGIGPSISAIIAEITPGSPAAAAGLQNGDRIAAVNGQPLFGADDIYETAYTATGPLALTVVRAGQELQLSLQPRGVRVLGVQAGSPAATAGLQKDDLILTVDDQPVNVVRKFIETLRDKPGKTVVLHLQRGTQELDLPVTPQVAIVADTGVSRPMIGFSPGESDGMSFLPMGKYEVRHPGPFEQLRAGVMSIVNTVDAVASPKSSISVQHMGGPVMMMNAYYNILSGPEGVRMALWFSVVLNVNLALLNLLPIPVLDGGHIMLAIIEAIRRKPVNVRILEFVQTGCALFIIGFMVFIAFFDVQDLPFFGSKPPAVKFQSTPAETVK